MISNLQDDSKFRVFLADFVASSGMQKTHSRQAAREARQRVLAAAG
jgi:hypothetical protein